MRQICQKPWKDPFREHSQSHSGKSKESCPILRVNEGTPWGPLTGFPPQVSINELYPSDRSNGEAG